MERALKDSRTCGNIKVSLTMFQEQNTEVYKAALSKLPDDFHAGSTRRCQAQGCVYNRWSVGERAYVGDCVRFCIWCDEEAMKQAMKDPRSLGHIKQSLTSFEQENSDVYESALAKLPADFVASPVRLCADPHCLFSTKAPGQKAVAALNSHLCSWCNPSAEATRETSVQGRRLIVAALGQFKAIPAVLIGAWAKRSADFKSAPERAAELVRERRAMRDEDLVSRCSGRTVLHRTEPAPCLACGQPQRTRIREEVKEFEVVAADQHLLEIGKFQKQQFSSHCRGTKETNQCA